MKTIKKMFVSTVDTVSCNPLLRAAGYLLSAIGYSDSLAVSLAERLFPLVPTLGRQEVGALWQSTEVYYFLEDRSPRIGQRLWAVLTLNRREVSFWRKRQQLIFRVRRDVKHADPTRTHPRGGAG